MSAHPIPIGERGLRYLDLDEPDDTLLYQTVCNDLHSMTYEQAMEWYDAVHAELTYKQKAYLGCNDRFYLAVFLLGRRDMVHPWLYARCREVENEPEEHLDLWARYHFKSSIITQTGVIQEIFINPDITVAIFSATAAISRKFLGQIKNALERNKMLIAVYDDVLWEFPKKWASRWSIEHGIVVKRTTTPKEGTVEAHGIIDSMPTGAHYQLLVYDDLITPEMVTNEEMIKKATERFEMSDNLGIGDGTRKWMLGTRYSFADTYGDLMRRKLVKTRVYPATDNGKLWGDPVFMSKETWEKVKDTQRSTVAAQMLQNPLAGKENMFDIEWFRPWEVRPTTLNVYILCDPSRGRTKRSDRTAIAVLGMDYDRNLFLLDGMRHRMKLSERWESLRNLHKKWSDMPGVQYVEVGYERYGQQSDDEYFADAMDREKYHFTITELAWPHDGKFSKKDRVERLEPEFRNSRFFLPALVWNSELGGICTWKVNAETEQIDYYPLVGPSKAMAAARRQKMDYLVAKPIRRIDEDGHIYDVTDALMMEMLQFPFALKDDLVDAVSRIFDIGPMAPVQYSRLRTEGKDYADS